MHVFLYFRDSRRPAEPRGGTRRLFVARDTEKYSIRNAKTSVSKSQTQHSFSRKSEARGSFPLPLNTDSEQTGTTISPIC